METTGKLHYLKPQVTVLTSVYNGASYLNEAIESVIHQTLTNFEFIIIDDASTDKSNSIIDNFIGIDLKDHIICIKNN